MKIQYLIAIAFLLSFSILIAQEKQDKTIGKTAKVTVNKTESQSIEKLKGTVNSTAAAVTYDFTVAGAAYTTGPDPMVEVETGVWAMIAGNADGSGAVDAADRSLAWNHRNIAGYYSDDALKLSSDLNLSGTVDATDRSLAWNNRNKITQVPVTP